MCILHDELCLLAVNLISRCLFFSVKDCERLQCFLQNQDLLYNDMLNLSRSVF